MLGKSIKMGKASLILRCLREYEIVVVLPEVHQVAYGNYIGGRALTHKLLLAYYY